MYAFPLCSLTNLPPWNARMHTKEESRARSFIIAAKASHFLDPVQQSTNSPRNSPRSTLGSISFPRWSPRGASNGHAETRVETERGLGSSHATPWLSLFARLIALRAAGGREATFDHETARRHAGNNGRPRWWPRTHLNGWLMALLSLCLEIFI